MDPAQGQVVLEAIASLEVRQPAIQSGQLHVFAQDECHLLWGDAAGYVWGRRGERTTVAIQNEPDGFAIFFK